MQYVVDRRGRKRHDIRKAGDETLEVGNDRRHLGLLQHDLRDPDAVRRTLLLPWKIMATAPRMPRDEFGGQARVGAFHNVNSNNAASAWACSSGGSPHASVGRKNGGGRPLKRRRRKMLREGVTGIEPAACLVYLGRWTLCG